MRQREKLVRIACGIVIGMLMLACSITFNAGGEKSEAEQTLEAIYLEQTQAALASGGGEDTGEAGVPEIEVVHETVPGNPGKAEVEKDEIDTENTADAKNALGDSFRLSNFERPFTESAMVYHPETDIVRLLLAKSDDFYYFTFELSGADKDENYPSAGYGIEFDTDYDGRGDYLLWGTGNASSEWNIQDMLLLEDGNDDVGGSNPVVPDSKDGNGYERVLFSSDMLDDPDVAWQRVDPSNSSNIQLAVKRSYIDNSRFYWRGWADAGVADPSLFDYNDSHDESQAGSPNKNSNYYPVGQLNLMDSTCWIAYNLEPTGTEVGGCVQIQATQPPSPTDEPGCACGGPPSSYGADCCTVCGFAWSSQTGTCYDPPD